MLDGLIAKDFYSDPSAENFIVYPTSGLRILDNKRWGTHDVTFDRGWSGWSYLASGSVQIKNKCSQGNLHLYYSYGFSSSRSHYEGQSVCIESNGPCVEYTNYNKCVEQLTGWH